MYDSFGTKFLSVFPRNVVSMGTLKKFLGHLSKNLSIDDQIYVSFADDEIAMSTLRVHAPLLVTTLDTLMSLEDIFIDHAAIFNTISMEACQDLSFLAQDENEQMALAEFGWNEEKYDKAKREFGMKWIQIFDIFPSLSKMVSLEFLLCHLKTNHARSYSVSSCKVRTEVRKYQEFLHYFNFLNLRFFCLSFQDIVGSELHLIVGR